MKNAPRSGAGEEALRLSGLPGLWKFSGLGVLSGIDWAAARVAADGLTPVAWPALAPLLAAFEAGAVAGAAARQKREAGGGDG